MSLFKKLSYFCVFSAFVLSIAVNASPRERLSPLLNLDGYQASSGLIQTFKNGTVADPYFGLYTLELGRRGGMNVSLVEKKFIEWGLSAQKEDGTFDRYCLKKTTWFACGTSDSHDATLARWVALLYAAAPADLPLPARWQRSADLSEKALMELRLKSGVFSVFKPGTPGYDGYALFKDNVEVLSAFEQVRDILLSRGDSVRAAVFDARAKDLKTAIAREFGENPFNMHRFAVGADYARTLFYPHAVAIPFGWLEGYFSKPSDKDWQQWLETSHTAWLENAKTDFPWGLIALSAYSTGPKDQASCWLSRTSSQRSKNYRWNVLEEVSYQVLASKKISKTECLTSFVSQTGLVAKK